MTTKRTYILKMTDPELGIRPVIIYADFLHTESGHFVFGKNHVGVFRSIAFSQVLELTAHENETEETDR